VNAVVKFERRGAIGIVKVDSPPVNALSAAVRGGIFDCITSATMDPTVNDIVLT
jgi:3-hydroxyacyl-CoA dehydrogenase